MCLHEMFTGKLPWPQPANAVYQLCMTEALPDPPEHITIAAKLFLEKCLTRDPSKRPEAASLLEEDFLVPSEDPALLRSVTPCIGGPGCRPARRSPWESGRFSTVKSFSTASMPSEVRGLFAAGPGGHSSPSRDAGGGEEGSIDMSEMGQLMRALQDELGDELNDSLEESFEEQESCSSPSEEEEDREDPSPPPPG